MDPRKKRIVFGILEFLGEEYNDPLTSQDAKESIEVATQCLETAFGVGNQDRQFKAPKTLRELYDSNPANTAEGDITDTTESTPLMMDQRGSEVMMGAVDLGPEYPMPPEASAEDKVQAEELKNKGNEAMRNSNYSEAMGYYNQAVELDGRNSVYFCNRAAAYMKLEDYDQSLRDCQIAIRLQPNYARAFGRMGVSYSNRNMHIEAIMCYRKALQLEPNNESYTTNLRYSQTMLAQAAQADAGPGMMGGMPAGGMGGLENLMRNPNLVNMASQMLRDPQMHQMIQNLMGGLAPPAQDAAPPQQPLGGDGLPSPAPGLESLMMMGQQIANSLRANNPQLAEQLQLNMGGLNLPGNNGPPNPNPDNNDHAPES